jgi:hypothetical protein
VAAVGTLGLSAAAPLPEVLLLTLVYGLIWQRVFGATVIAERYLNERLVHAGDDERLDLHDSVERWHLTSMAVDLLRGAALTLLALVLGVPVLRLAVTSVQLPSSVAALAVASAAVAVLLGTARAFDESRRSMFLLLLGVLCGSALLFVR